MATYTEDDIVHFELPAREPRDDTDPRANERQFAFFDGTLFTNKARSEQRQVSEERDLALSPQTVDLSLHNLFDPLNDGDEGTFIVHIIGGGDPPSPTGLVTVTGRPEPPPAGREGVIDFDNQESLLSMFDLERADDYTEEGFVFSSGVFPPDSRLGGTAPGHYRLDYPSVTDRALSNVEESDVIQMTYDDPDVDGEANPFGLESIRVLGGTLNLGVRYANGDIAVYNNLTAGTHHLIDATDLTRVTLEAIGSMYTVDEIDVLIA